MTVSPETLVERFYHEVWRDADEHLARDILTPDFQFRGSLGVECDGPDGFIGYMRMIHAALAGFDCIIEDMIVARDRVAARMTFRGIHRGPLLGVAATGRTVAWAGAAFFRVRGDRISELWVLGDLDGLKRQFVGS